MERENKYYKEYDRGVYSQSNNYYNNFFDMVNHYKDNKDELKNFLKDLVLFKVREYDDSIECRYTDFVKKDKFEEYINDQYAEGKILKISPIEIDEESFENKYVEIKNGDFSDLNIYNDNDNNRILREKETFEMNFHEINPEEIRNAIDTIFKGIEYLKENENQEININMKLNKDVYYNEFKMEITSENSKKLELQASEFCLFADKSLKYLTSNGINLEDDLDSNIRDYDYGEFYNVSEDEKEETIFKIKNSSYDDISSLTTRNLEDLAIKSDLLKSIELSYNTSDENIKLIVTDKDNKQNEIELEKNDKANIIIANIIGREKFADLYFQIKKDSFEKDIDKVKTKEKDIEL